MACCPGSGLSVLRESLVLVLSQDLILLIEVMPAVASLPRLSTACLTSVYISLKEAGCAPSCWQRAELLLWGASCRPHLPGENTEAMQSAGPTSSGQHSVAEESSPGEPASEAVGTEATLLPGSQGAQPHPGAG